MRQAEEEGKAGKEDRLIFYIIYLIFMENMIDKR